MEAAELPDHLKKTAEALKALGEQYVDASIKALLEGNKEEYARLMEECKLKSLEILPLDKREEFDKEVKIWLKKNLSICKELLED